MDNYNIKTSALPVKSITLTICYMCPQLYVFWSVFTVSNQNLIPLYFLKLLSGYVWIFSSANNWLHFPMILRELLGYTDAARPKHYSGEHLTPKHHLLLRNRFGMKVPGPKCVTMVMLTCTVTDTSLFCKVWFRLASRECPSGVTRTARLSSKLIEIEMGHCTVSSDSILVNNE